MKKLSKTQKFEQQKHYLYSKYIQLQPKTTKINFILRCWSHLYKLVNVNKELWRTTEIAKLKYVFIDDHFIGVECFFENDNFELIFHRERDEDKK